MTYYNPPGAPLRVPAAGAFDWSKGISPWWFVAFGIAALAVYDVVSRKEAKRAESTAGALRRIGKRAEAQYRRAHA